MLFGYQRHQITHSKQGKERRLLQTHNKSCLGGTEYQNLKYQNAIEELHHFRNFIYAKLYQGLSILAQLLSHLIIINYFMLDTERLADIYQTLESSDFDGKVYFSQWNKSRDAANFILQCLSLEKMQKIYHGMKQMLSQTSKFYFFLRGDMQECIEQSEWRCRAKQEQLIQAGQRGSISNNQSTAGHQARQGQQLQEGRFICPPRFPFVERKFQRRIENKSSHFKEEEEKEDQDCTETTNLIKKKKI